jgi:hypothetical protein
MANAPHVYAATSTKRNKHMSHGAIHERQQPDLATQTHPAYLNKHARARAPTRTAQGSRIAASDGQS